MKKLTLIIAVLALPFFALADSITLNTTETLVTPTAAAISEWEITKINAADKVMTIKYRWRDSGGGLINLGTGRLGWQYWNCSDISQGDNASCTAVDDPWNCCTGSGTGTCPEDVDTCFSDVFGFQIRAQDVGTGIGDGLRTLIWNQMKSDILTGGNDGSFD